MRLQIAAYEHINLQRDTIRNLGLFVAVGVFVD